MADIKKDLVEKIKNKINNNLSDKKLKNLLLRLIDYESMNEEQTFKLYKDHYNSYIEESLDK
jgi:hypothetical protein|tara:strand:- start:696 stop:881 length:186 start_codon:yes stop_codon:yes gene_type:complete